MKATVYLRIASVMTLVHSVMHTIGGVFGGTPEGPASVAAAAMKSNQFQFMGATRTFWEFHRGLGLAVTIFLTAEAVVFWLLGTLVKRDGDRLRPILAVFALGYLAFAVNSLVYFFTLPVIFETAIAACLVAAMASSKNSRVEN
jgi:MFS family permease